MTAPDDDLNPILRALADTTRRRIIDELGRRERQSLFEIYSRVISEHGISQSRQGFSRHLAVLEDVGIIEVAWQGTTKLHTLNRQPLARLLQHEWWQQFEEKT